MLKLNQAGGIAPAQSAGVETQRATNIEEENIMKTNLLSISTMCGLALLPLATFADEVSGMYYSVDVGGTIVEDVRLKEFPGATPGGKVELDPGARLSFGIGYRFNEWLSMGGETGFSGNKLSGAEATLSQAPLLANVEFRMPNNSPLVPFIGGGPGVSISVLTIDDDQLRDGTRVDGSDGDAVFAWQAYGGVRYKITDMMSVGLLYKYLSVNSSTLDVRRSSQNIRFGEVHMHTFSASFSVEF